MCFSSDFMWSYIHGIKINILAQLFNADPEETSLKIQNRGTSGPKIGHMCPPKILKKEVISRLMLILKDFKDHTAQQRWALIIKKKNSKICHILKAIQL